MLVRKTFFAAAGLLIAGLAVAQTNNADVIFQGGEIYTPKGWVQALAVSNGVIIALGDGASVSRVTGPQTKVVDLKGATVLPGFHDTHVHPMGSGMMHTQCTFPQGSPPNVVLDTVKACVARHKKGEWISGGQWDAASFGKTPVHHSLLDKVAPDNPVALTDISVHAVWLNAKALELAGITAKTPNPEGGVIERDAKGEPTGVLRESARGLLARITPPPSPEQNMEALKWAMGEMLSYGITAYIDAGIGEEGLQAYATLADRGELKQRVQGCIAWRPSFGSASMGTPDPIERRNLYTRDRFNPTCIKIVLDGVPTDGHTAAMVEPYADASQTDSTRARGMLMVPSQALKAAVVDFDAHGLTVKMHAAGDAAVRAGLDAIEAARRANGFTGLLHNVSHNSFVQMSDFQRARELSATFEMSPYIWYPNPIIPDIAKAIGPERMRRWTPVKDAIDSGALVVPGSDWAVVPSVNPWIAIETLVTRKAPGGAGEALGEVEKISLEQALDLFTVNSARLMGDRSRTGSIERGMLADLVVVDRNPFKIPITQVHDVRVKMTVINGEIVYQSRP
jgi:predicted amidohydrolase YtcJ